jgi:hypothetical protein
MVGLSDVLHFWDVLLYIGLFAIWAFVWATHGKRKPRSNDQPPPSIPDVQERSLSANVIGSFVTSGLTATSILIPASFVIIQLGLGNTKVPAESLGQVAFSFYWFVFSIAVGIFNTARFPTMVGRTDLAKDRFSNVLGFMQLLAILLGVIRMAIAVSLLNLNL